MQLPREDVTLANVVAAGRASLNWTWESEELLLAFVTTASYKSQTLFPSKVE